MSLALESRIALRSLVARPVTSLVIAATFGLGLGATAAWLDLLNLALWRVPAAREPAALVQVYSWHHHAFVGPWGYTPLADYRFYRDEATTLSGLAAFQSTSLAPGETAASAEGDSLPAYAVSGNYFEVLGVEMSRGRPLVPSDDRAGAEPVAVLGHRLWERRFGADEAIVGRPLRLEDRSFRVVGVGPPGFRGALDAQSADVFVPMAAIEDRLDPEARRTTLIGRRRPAAALAAVRAEMDALAEELERVRPAPGLERRLTVVPARLAHPIDRRDLTPFLRLFGVGAALLLVLAGANVSSLLIGDALRRARETGVRKALGASTWQLLRRPLLEASLLAASGAALGLLLAAWSRRLLELFVGSDIAGALRFDPRVLLLLALAAVLLALGAAGLPAWVARRTPALSLLKGTASGLAPRSIGALAAGQVALSVVLLTATGLLGLTVHNLLNRDLGFDASNLVRATLELPQDTPAEEGRRLQRRFRERALATTAIGAAGAAQLLPPFVLDASVPFRLPGDDAARIARFNVVDGAFFEALGIPLLSGRLFDDRDAASSEGVAIVNRALARQLWPEGVAVGRRLRLEDHRAGDGGPDLRVVGVVASTAQHDLRQEEEAVLYLASEQRYRTETRYVFRTAGAMAPAAAALRHALAGLPPGARLSGIQAFETYRWESAVRERLSATGAALLGGAALFLAILGVFGVTSQAVSRETRAIGVRMALGARRLDVVRWIVGRGVRLALAGALAGAPLAFAAVRLMQGSLFRTGGLRGLAVAAAVLALVLGAAALAAFLPSRRAAALDPAATLRSET